MFEVNPVGKHIFACLIRPKSGTACKPNGQPMFQEKIILRCRVLEYRSPDYFLAVIEGNGNPELDGTEMTFASHVPLRYERTGYFRVEEIHGAEGIGPLSIWQDRPQRPQPS